MAYTSTTTFASAIITKHFKDVLKIAEGMLAAPRFAVKDYEHAGESGTVRWNRVLRLPKITAATAEGTLLAHASAKALTSNYIEASPVRYEDSIAFSDKVDLTSWIKKATSKKTIANQIARTTEYFTMKYGLARGMFHRVDNDATYQGGFTITNTSSTTSLVASALTHNDDAFNGGRVVFTGPEGPCYDEGCAVTDFDAASDTATIATLTNTPTTSSKGYISGATGIVATDLLTTDALIRVAAMHEKLETDKFPGGVFRCFIDAAQHANLWADTTFKNSAIYDKSERFKSLQLGRWFDIEFMVNSEMYRTDADGTENQATGAVYVTPIFGADSYAAAHWGSGDPVFGINVFPVDNADATNLTKAMHWISWKGHFNVCPIRQTSIIDLLTGATDLGIVL